MTVRERLKMLMESKLAEKAARAHATAVADARAGFVRTTRSRLHIVAPSRNYTADHTGEWNCSISEDAPIWAPCRKGTRVWRVGEEVRDVER